ncbi:fumarylacetoacetate hydrolase family protein [Yinghuangia sp. YIM S09857]|uniref:fumarylacetoacetate hydrolase family protein n=1 Tax=Yinghuangia sp. YIM S09857 TaxID=3436929 RepID=UPI003F52D3A5
MWAPSSPHRGLPRAPPAHPTLVTEVAGTLVGAGDDIVGPPETQALDREVELVVVVGSAPSLPPTLGQSRTSTSTAAESRWRPVP